ncbi:MAG TPA: metalloregulator ArsR/SmtB family transcription factor [Caldisericia bacterium]|nr:metalloregulator ArsR/SmtB family transcription factor [Caldisericia bacterium]HXK51950.1 metalloregulator ArsR/SmtB family transcription factor [Caldisericia bacterium]
MKEHEKIVLFAKALQDENRLQIVEMLQSGEKCACKLLEHLQIEQSTLSHHMKILCQSGLIAWKKVGKWMHYSIDPEEANNLLHLLQNLTKVNDSSQDQMEIPIQNTSCQCNHPTHKGTAI